MPKRVRTAQVKLSPEDNQLEILLPPKFKYEDVARVTEDLLRQTLLEGLRHGCAACLSGMPIVIREQFENEVTVNLETMRPIGFE